MRELVRRWRRPIPLILGSHSALDAAAGFRDYGIPYIIYTTRARAHIYFREPRVGYPNEYIEDLPAIVRRDLRVVEDFRDLRQRDWRGAIVLLDHYEDILKKEIIDELLELECVQVPNRAFSVYVGGYACQRIENNFPVPILGSRGLLKIENREEVEKNYYWFLEKAGIPHPQAFEFEVTEKGIRLKERVETPIVLKAPHATRRFERGFVFAADADSLEAEVERRVASGELLLEDLKHARIEEYIPGVTANFNFFYSPLNAEENWGDVERYVSRKRLANEFLSIDERRETTHDGWLRLLASEQLKVRWDKTRYPLTFEVTAHGLISLRESLLRKIYPIADALVDLFEKEEPPGIIGPYCIQTLITFTETPYVTGVEVGVYDAPSGTFHDFVPVVQDLAMRHGGGTNVHMGIGSQYANTKYQRVMSTGQRLALEFKRAIAKNKLDLLVT